MLLKAHHLITELIVNARPSRITIIVYCINCRCLVTRDRYICILHNNLGQFIKEKKTNNLNKMCVGFRGVNSK